jgi:hypothetical protein
VHAFFKQKVLSHFQHCLTPTVGMEPIGAQKRLSVQHLERRSWPLHRTLPFHGQPSKGPVRADSLAEEASFISRSHCLGQHSFRLCFSTELGPRPMVYQKLDFTVGIPVSVGSRSAPMGTPL